MLGLRERFFIRFDLLQRRTITEAAALAGETPTAFCRRAILSQVDRTMTAHRKESARE